MTAAIVVCSRPWQQPSRLRSWIVYGYWSIDLDVLITTAVKHLPAVAARLIGFTVRDRLGERSW